MPDFCRLSDQGALKITGTDARRFLHNQTTNDVNALSEGQAQWNAAVDRQGKIRGVFSLRLEHGAYFLLMAKAAIPLLMAHFNKFKIMDDVEFEDVSHQYTVYGIPGDYPVTVKPGGRELSPEEWTIRRVEMGMPQYGVDYDDETMLLETGLQQTHVSYDKGCYLGQEVIARVKTYGTLPMALCGLVFDETIKTPPVLNSEGKLDGKTVARIKSGVFSPSLKHVIAFAYLDKTHRVPGQALTLDIGGKLYAATVTTLPFVKSRAEESALLREKALRLFSQGEEAEAIALLRKGLASYGEEPDTLEALGAILGRSNDTLDEAMAMMARVLAVDSDHVMAHTNLSIYWLKKGDKEKAEEEKAKATIATMRKRAKEAGLKLPSPDDEKQRKEKMLRERIAMFEEALAHDPDDPLGNFGLGSAYLELEEFEPAVSPLEKTLAVQPKHTVAYLSLGKALIGSQKPEKAKTVLQKGIEVASQRGDMMPLSEMQRLVATL